MRLGRTMPLTRRAFATGFSGVAALIGMGKTTPASGMAKPVAVLDPDLRDAALRGLALAGHRGDPVQAAMAEAALARLAQTDPEGALLGRIYQILDVRPAVYWTGDAAGAAAPDLAALHAAIRASQPVGFRYTDLEGNKTTRTVLPLALVHPPQGVKLLAWCTDRKGFRQFFVRAAQGVTVLPGDFSMDRITLLQGLLDKETGRA